MFQQQVESNVSIAPVHCLRERVDSLSTHIGHRVPQVLGDLLDVLWALQAPERPDRRQAQKVVTGSGRSDERAELVLPDGPRVLQGDDL